MDSVICRFYTREDPEGLRRSRVTVHKAKAKATRRKKTTTTKKDIRISGGSVSQKKETDPSEPASTHRSDKPWDVEKREVTNVSKTQTEEVVAEELVEAYHIVVENNAAPKNSRAKVIRTLPPRAIMVAYFRQAITVNWIEMDNAQESEEEDIADALR